MSTTHKITTVKASSIICPEVNSNRMATAVGTKNLKSLIEKFLVSNNTVVEPLIVYPVTNENDSQSYQNIEDFIEAYDGKDINFSVLQPSEDGEDLPAKYTLPSKLNVRSDYKIKPQFAVSEGNRRTVASHIVSILTGEDLDIGVIVYPDKESADKASDCVNNNKEAFLKLSAHDHYAKARQLITEGVLRESDYMKRTGVSRNISQKVFGIALVSNKWKSVGKAVEGLNWSKVKHTDGSRIRKVETAEQAIEIISEINMRESDNKPRAVAGKDIEALADAIGNPEFRDFLMAICEGDVSRMNLLGMQINIKLDSE